NYNFDNLISNWRLIEWSLTHVKYNATNERNGKEKLVIINFSDYKLPSPRTGELKPLTEFQHVCHSLVFLVAERLITNANNTSIQSTVIRYFNITLSFYYYLFLRNKYFLRDATMSDTNSFIRDMAKGGIHKALN